MTDDSDCDVDDEEFDYAKVLREMPVHPLVEALRKTERLKPLYPADEEKLFRWQLERATKGDPQPIVTELRRQMVRGGKGWVSLSPNNVRLLIQFFEGTLATRRGRGRSRSESWQKAIDTPSNRLALRKESAVKDYRIVASRLGVGRLRGRKERVLKYIARRDGLALSALENAVGRSAKIANK